MLSSASSDDDDGDGGEGRFLQLGENLDCPAVDQNGTSTLLSGVGDTDLLGFKADSLLSEGHERDTADELQSFVSEWDMMIRTLRIADQAEISSTGDIETLLIRHLARLEASDKAREAQLVLLKHLNHDMTAVAALGLDPDDTLDPAINHLWSVNIDRGDSDEQDDHDEETGWTGLSKHTPISLESQDSSFELVVPLTPALDSIAEEAEFTTDPFSFPRDRLNSAASQSPLPLAPRLTAELARSTLPIDLAHFAESLHTDLSSHTAQSRLLRGIKAAIESFKERESAEEAARQAIDVWGRECVERGLRGERSLGGQMQLDVLAGFAGAMDRWEFDQQRIHGAMRRGLEGCLA